MKPIVRGLFVFGLLCATVRLGFAANCASDDPDGSKTAAARASAEQTCTAAMQGCGNAPNHGAYVSCMSHALNALVSGGSLPKSCKGMARKCAARSTCGKPQAVTCCLANQSGHGHSKCSIKNDAAACLAKNGCVGNFASCCDACATDGSCNPAPTTSTTTTTTTVPTLPLTTTT